MFWTVVTAWLPIAIGLSKSLKLVGSRSFSTTYQFSSRLDGRTAVSVNSRPQVTFWNWRGNASDQLGKGTSALNPSVTREKDFLSERPGRSRRLRAFRLSR